MPPRPAKDIRTLLNEDTPEEAIDLILKLLRFVPSQRITAQQALDHPFFNEIKKKAVSKAKSASRKVKEVTLIGQKRAKSATDDSITLEGPTKRKKSNQASVEGKCAKAAQKVVGSLSTVAVKKVK
jgi:serine/threonine protein kinase